MVATTSARLLRLLSLLQARRDWSGPELAERLAVSTRTIRNDVERLRGLGYPVHATPGVAGGYRLGAGAALPPLLLDDDEAVAVAIGLRTAAGGAVAGIEETSVRALAKLGQVLPSRLRRRVNALQTYTVPLTSAAAAGRDAPTVDGEVLATLAGACRDRERLRFDYRDHHGGSSLRVTEPYRLVCWGRRWYLVAWDVERADWRTFRADRIAPRTPTGPRFSPRALPDEDVARYVARRMSAVWRYHARIRMHAPATALADRLPPSAGLLEPIDEHTCLLDTGSDSLDMIVTFLGILGVDFEVVEPPELVDRLRAMADRYLRAIPSP
jgi:predicted DNA-binding transcriptional regulator YafY